MKKYYQQAVALHHANSCHCLGYYYKHVERDYVQMKYYYEKAIAWGSGAACNNLARYYQKIEGNAEQMKYYFLLAIDRGEAMAAFNLADYYRYQEIDEAKMVTYYLQAVELGYLSGLNSLGYYYQTMGQPEKTIYYYTLALEKDHPLALSNLSFYYWNHPSLDGLDFALKYRRDILIRDIIAHLVTWQPQLIRLRLLDLPSDYLNELALEMKQQLMIEYRQILDDPTSYFRQRSVRDIFNLVFLYLSGD